MLEVGRRLVPLEWVRNPRAKRYIVRVCAQGTVRVTVPRHGNIRDARAFTEQHSEWISRQLNLRKHSKALDWRSTDGGFEALYRGRMEEGTFDAAKGIAVFAGYEFHGILTRRELRHTILEFLKDVARLELPRRTRVLAERFNLRVNRITIRSQRARWGSCSSARNLSLNWRLVQCTPQARDYVIIHELMHLRELNHSPRFWRLVERACPNYRQSESWLNDHSSILGPIR